MPAATLASASGSTVAARWASSISREPLNALTVLPPCEVSETEVIVISNEITESAGASPILSWVLLAVRFVLELPPQPVKSSKKASVAIVPNRTIVQGFAIVRSFIIVARIIMGSPPFFVFSGNLAAQAQDLEPECVGRLERS